jgi:4-amino-4-deoxychorismate lyase
MEPQCTLSPRRGARSAPPPRPAPQVIDRLYNARHKKAADTFGAFYSSELGGIVTDDSLMFIHIDDHMVHRGHGVFEACALVDGHVYELPKHLERLKRSAEAAGIPPPPSDAAVLRIILDTAAASKKLTGARRARCPALPCSAPARPPAPHRPPARPPAPAGQVRFWLTAGRGGFALSPEECTEPGFYVMVTSEVPQIDRMAGWQAALSPLAPKDPYFARLKSNNYLQNVLAHMEAAQRGFNTVGGGGGRGGRGRAGGPGGRGRAGGRGGGGR